MGRVSKDDNYLNMAQEAADRATCLRRKYGVVLVKNDEVISTGYCGAPRGADNCCDLGTCKREELGIPSGERYELCRSVHAEQNAMLSPSRAEMIGSTLYLVGLDAKTGEIIDDAECCLLCKRLITNAGIATVVIRRKDNDKDLQDVYMWNVMGLL